MSPELLTLLMFLTLILCIPLGHPLAITLAAVAMLFGLIDNGFNVPALLDLFVNNKAFDSLSAENKAIIEAASALAHNDMLSKYDSLNPGALKQLVAAKTKVLPFPQAVLEASFKASMEVFEENNAKSPEWKKIYADMRNFQRDQILWFRFAESRFDTFMSSKKL